MPRFVERPVPTDPLAIDLGEEPAAPTEQRLDKQEAVAAHAGERIGYE